MNQKPTTRRLAPPPTILVAAADEIDSAVGLLLKDVCSPFPDAQRFESNVEARVLFFGLVRHLEAVLECARADMVLLPGASTLSRAVLEQSVKVRWMLHPDDVFAREARFLAHLRDEERMWERCARIAGNDDFGKHAEPLRSFRSAVEALLPAEVARMPQGRKLDEMMREVGDYERYFAYTLLSQYVHGSHHAGSIFRRNLGTSKELAERVRVSAWYVPLEVCWWGAFHAAQTIERVCAQRPLRSIEAACTESIALRLEELKVSSV